MARDHVVEVRRALARAQAGLSVTSHSHGSSGAHGKDHKCVCVCVCVCVCGVCVSSDDFFCVGHGKVGTIKRHIAGVRQ